MRCHRLGHRGQGSFAPGYAKQEKTLQGKALLEEEEEEEEEEEVFEGLLMCIISLSRYRF